MQQLRLFDLKIPEIEISVKMKGAKNSELPIIKSSDDIYKILKSCFSLYKINWVEEVVMACLNKSNKMIGFFKVSSGGVAESIVDPKVIFTVALNTPGTCAIILAHNHPQITKKIKDG